MGDSRDSSLLSKPWVGCSPSNQDDTGQAKTLAGALTEEEVLVTNGVDAVGGS
jgi:hypothetical protein